MNRYERAIASGQVAAPESARIGDKVPVSDVLPGEWCQFFARESPGDPWNTYYRNPKVGGLNHPGSLIRVTGVACICIYVDTLVTIIPEPERHNVIL